MTLGGDGGSQGSCYHLTAKCSYARGQSSVMRSLLRNSTVNSSSKHSSLVSHDSALLLELEGGRGMGPPLLQTARTSCTSDSVHCVTKNSVQQNLQRGYLIKGRCNHYVHEAQSCQSASVQHSM